MAARSGIRLRFVAVVGLLVAAGTAYWAWPARQSFDPAAAEKAYTALRARVDPAHPGRGIADYPGFPVADVPKSYAMLVVAELERRRHHPNHDLGMAETAVRWLLEHADENHDGMPGWGVPVAWDAYGDGTENPANTEYAISTAIAVKALLDWAETKPPVAREQIERVVAATLDHWARDDIRTPAGLLPYSLEASDRRYDTFNPAAALAGQMQRFAAQAAPALAERLRGAADATMQALLAHRQVDGDGNWYWSYSVQEDNPNDMGHAVYIMDGIAQYVRSGGRLGDRFDLKRIAGHLRSFLRNDGTFLSAWPTFHQRINYPARSYDIGAGLWFAARQPELASDVAPRMAQFLPTYHRADGWYRKYPDAGDKKGGDDTAIGEYQSYILCALAAWGK